MGVAVNVWIVTTWNQPCGISEFAAYLTEAVTQADPSIVHTPITDLHPNGVFQRGGEMPDLVVLNYHSALLSQWQPEHLRALKAKGIPTVCVWHDSGVPNSDHCKSIHAVADAFVVHEPCEDLPGARYWRQGVPDWPTYHTTDSGMRPPTVGSVGFPFAWKNFDLLCEAANIAGWCVMLLAPTATDEDIARWRRLLPWTQLTVERSFLPRKEVVYNLSQCDATAFLYNTHNTGTSGAIRQGIAARKPVIASRFPFGRQFRDLHADPLAARAITWVEPSLEKVVAALSQVRIAPIDAGMVALAEQDSWKGLGVKYAALYKELAHV